MIKDVDDNDELYLGMNNERTEIAWNDFMLHKWDQCGNFQMAINENRLNVIYLRIMSLT